MTSDRWEEILLLVAGRWSLVTFASRVEDQRVGCRSRAGCERDGFCLGCAWWPAARAADSTRHAKDGHRGNACGAVLSPCDRDAREVGQALGAGLWAGPPWGVLLPTRGAKGGHGGMLEALGGGGGWTGLGARGGGGEWRSGKVAEWQSAGLVREMGGFEGGWGGREDFCVCHGVRAELWATARGELGTVATGMRKWRYT